MAKKDLFYARPTRAANIERAKIGHSRPPEISRFGPSSKSLFFGYVKNNRSFNEQALSYTLDHEFPTICNTWHLKTWQKQFYSLAALVRKILFCHSKIKFVSSRPRVISSLYIE